MTSPPPGWDARGLDILLDAFPAGKLSEIVASGSSGGSGLLVALLARATASAAHVAIVDGADSFDPTLARIAGADLSRLLWVRCGGQWRKAWKAADLLARCPGFAVVALDLAGVEPRAGDPAAPMLCLRLQRAVEQSAAALVLRGPRRLAGTAASLVVAVRRRETRWVGLPRPSRLAGLVSEVEIVRGRIDGGAGGGPLRQGTWLLEWRL